MGCQQSSLKGQNDKTLCREAQHVPCSPVAVVVEGAITITDVQDSQFIDATPTEAADQQEGVAADKQSVSVAAPSIPSPKRFGERTVNDVNNGAVAPKAALVAPTFSDFLQTIDNTNENIVATNSKRKVVFDAETMRKTAPKSKATNAASSLSKKQKEMLKRSHVSAGRRGPVASKWDKGGKAHMQTDVYLDMAAAFERMLTNAETINAHLDSR